MIKRLVVDASGLAWTAELATDSDGYDGLAFVRFSCNQFARPVVGTIAAGTFAALAEHELVNVLNLAVELYLSIGAITAPPRTRELHTRYPRAIPPEHMRALYE